MPDELPSGVVHIAGVDLQVGNQLRQRCGWCGAVLMDYDLANTMVALDRARTVTAPRRTIRCVRRPRARSRGCRNDGYLEACPIGAWSVGALVSIDGGVLHVVEHEDGAELPANACAKLPHDITGSVERG